MTKVKTTQARGFTLVELMIVVAIIAVLASIATVAYVSYFKSARETEAMTFLLTVAAAEEQYQSDFGSYISASANPAVIPSPTQKLNWDSGNANWVSLGAAPKAARVAFSYQAKGSAGATCASSSPPAGLETPVCAGLGASTSWWWAIGRNTDTVVVINSVRQAPWPVPAP